MNTSATGGPLLPTDVGPPLEGQALNRFLQQWIVGITGMNPKMVRPYFQTEPPNVPNAGTVWMAFRYDTLASDTFPYVRHDGAAAGGNGADVLQRNQDIGVLCSFYDTGTNGQASAFSALLRDGCAIPQNQEYLLAAGFAMVACGNPVVVPSLLQNLWLYREDLPVTVRRQVDRTYVVQNIVSAGAGLVTDVEYERDIVVAAP